MLVGNEEFYVKEFLDILKSNNDKLVAAIDKLTEAINNNGKNMTIKK